MTAVKSEMFYVLIIHTSFLFRVQLRAPVRHPGARATLPEQELRLLLREHPHLGEVGELTCGQMLKWDFCLEVQKLYLMQFIISPCNKNLRIVNYFLA